MPRIPRSLHLGHVATMPKVLIGSGPIRNQPGPFRDLLIAAGFTPVDWPGHLPLSADDYRAVISEVEAIVAGGEPY